MSTAKTKHPESITGRNGYIVAQALATFIQLQKKLPDYAREYSNAIDAQLILDTLPMAEIAETMVAAKFERLQITVPLVEPLA